MSPSSRVIITGAGGVIGRMLMTSLEDDYSLRGIDRRRTKGDALGRANLRWPVCARRAVREADTVVDLAAGLTDRWLSVWSNNLPTTWNVFDAARRAGVRRVVYFSSNHVTGMYERESPYREVIAGDYGTLEPSSLHRLDSAVPVRPDGPYGVSKAFGEAVGRYVSDRYGLSVICLRIGTVNEQDRPTKPREFATFLSKRDLCALVRCCVEAPATLRFGIFYGVSRNTWRFWDLAAAAAEIGFHPLDDAEAWRNGARVR